MRSTYEQEFITLKRIGEGNFTFVDMVLSRTTNLPYAIKRSKQPMLKPSGTASATMSTRPISSPS